jgi:hypothetical protein
MSLVVWLIRVRVYAPDDALSLRLKVRLLMRLVISYKWIYFFEKLGQESGIGRFINRLLLS